MVTKSTSTHQDKGGPVEPIIEYDLTGRYRIRCNKTGKTGEWTAFTDVAQLESYIGFSEYFDTKIAHKVFKVSAAMIVTDIRTNVSSEA